MTLNEFDQLAEQGYQLVPLQREILADLDTPLSTYIKLAEGPYSYLLESVTGGEKWGRYSVIGLPSREVVKIYGHQVVRELDGEQVESITVEQPLDWVEQFRKSFKVAPVAGLDRQTGGLVGYFGYDTVRYIEPRLGECQSEDQMGTPDILLMVSREVVVFDNLSGKLLLVVYGDTEDAQGYLKAEARLKELELMLRLPRPMRRNWSKPQQVTEADFQSGFTEQGFKEAVDKCKEYIYNGDIMQVVLSQRLSVPYQAPPLDLYRALRSLNPSPYMFFMDLGDHQVVGSSPEILVRLEHGDVTVRPIAGTRHRGATEQEDKALEQELLADPKELAEHLMLIDLGRNDIGRVSEVGTVQLTDKMVVERYSHVMHIVSNVTGKLKPEMSSMDVLKATFPAGTVSGAAKVRAMEIIDELEPVKRGIYSGAVGYLSWQGDMDTAIAIRTAVIKDHTLFMQAGAGIVADSIAQNEWEETMNKSRAVFRAASLAAAGLD
ncbi:anthranilate synthase component I [Pelagibaculum spongiae]|uniref:Anthranilate synthase component 1 n=1 Tax=Pelagibaculum spongiae TaxID=2080658 RepID=A0A2V1GPY1_9GAMM|nr:anthranilate synthase component I [Pelagibaculum spongiae]PVZ65396.1 anthranilate synthase component I [Pelagibaculum spongiae]